MRNQAILLAFLSFIAIPVHAEPTCSWGRAAQVGALDPALVPEASGLAASIQYPDRLYHINDSGASGAFFVSNGQGGALQQVRIQGFRPTDTEDLGYGPCLNGRSCLFVGDIGDNAERRTSIRIVIIEEKAGFAASVTPAATLRVTYPDRPHNAEGMSVHPNGDIYILTKESSGPSLLFRLRQQIWETALPGSTLQLETVGPLDLSRIGGSGITTGFNIAPDGKHFLVLDYSQAFEFAHDLASGAPRPTSQMAAGVDYVRIRLTRLAQQEAIAYLPNGRAFLYDTESRANDPTLPPIMQVSCQ